MPNFLNLENEQPTMIVVSKYSPISELNSQSNAEFVKKISKGLILISFLAIGSVFFVANIHAADNVNLYAKNYKVQNQNNLKSLSANPDTKMFVSNHKDEDNIAMMEDGFDMMGTSGFEAGNVSADLALAYGKSIKADTVLVYSKYGSAKTPDSKIQLIKEAMKTKREVTAKDLEPEEEKYNYYASYWAKLPTPLMGVHVIKLIQSTDNGPKPEAGLIVIAVIKESAASNASLVKGDVLLKLGDAVMDQPDDLFAAVKRYAGQTIPVVYERAGDEVTKNITIGSRK